MQCSFIMLTHPKKREKKKSTTSFECNTYDISLWKPFCPCTKPGVLNWKDRCISRSPKCQHGLDLQSLCVKETGAVTCQASKGVCSLSQSTGISLQHAHAEPCPVCVHIHAQTVDESGLIIVWLCLNIFPTSYSSPSPFLFRPSSSI